MGSPFWNFSIAVYGASAIQDECLNLQDQFGLDVNLILLCAFLGAVHGVTLTSDDIASVRQEVGQWHEQIVRPLRAARRHLKTINLQDADAASAADLRRQVKTAELESERIEQILLERWADTRLATWPRGKLREAVVANLQTLLAAYGVGPERLVAAHAMQHLIAAGLDRTANA
jgi:TIGR02444 family protein